MIIILLDIEYYILYAWARPQDFFQGWAMCRGVSRGEAGGLWPLSSIEWIFYGEKLALLGRRGLGPTVLIRVINYCFEFTE